MARRNTRDLEKSSGGHRSRHETTAEKPGRRIGRYVVVSRLGEGAMGMVYLAYDPQLDRRVALKVLRRRTRSRRASQERQQRLRREAQAMAQLNHARVVTVHDVGVADGRVFLAMDYVEGQTLREWLDARARPWNEVLRVLVYAGQGLAAAHAAGVIHRDFKPENVLVGRDGSVKVMDFGLARPQGPASRSSGLSEVPDSEVEPPVPDDEPPVHEVESPAPDDGSAMHEVEPPAPDDESAMHEVEPPAPDPTAPKKAVHQELPALERAPQGWWRNKSDLLSGEGPPELTRSGDVLGTPSYMAPELFEGGEADAPSDQFAFCVALYEGLYGVRPFAGETMAALAFNINRGRFNPGQRGRRVPTWLGKLVRRGLALDPQRRFPAMTELLDALIQGAGRRRVRRAGMAAVGLLLAGGAASYTLVDRPPPCRGGELRLRAVWNEERASGMKDAFLATGTAFADEAHARAEQRLHDYASTWIGVYTEVCEATAVHGDQSPELLDQRISCLDGRLAELGALLSVFDEADSRVAERAAQAVSELRSPTACAEEQVAERRRAAKPEHQRALDQLRGRLLRAQALEKAGRYEDATTQAREIAAEAERIDQVPLRVEALIELGVAEDHNGDYPAAAKALREAYFLAHGSGLDLLSARAAAVLVMTEGVHLAKGEEGLAWARHARAAIERGHGGDELRAHLHKALGSLHLMRFELAEARENLASALSLLRGLRGDDHEEVAELLATLGVVLEQSGESEDAVSSFEQAIAIHRRALGAHHPALAILHNNYAVILFGRQDFARARLQLEQAVEIQREALGEHPALAHTVDNLGGLLVMLGEREQGRALIEEGLALRETLFGTEHPATANSQANLAGTFAMEGDLGNARRLYERALDTFQRTLGPDNPQVANNVYNLAILALREGRIQRGFDLSQQAYDTMAKLVGPDNDSLANFLMGLGWSYLELNKPEEALKRLERAYALRKVGAAEYGPMVRLLLSKALREMDRDPARAEALRRESAGMFAEQKLPVPERIAGWLAETQP